RARAAALLRLFPTVAPRLSTASLKIKQPRRFSLGPLCDHVILLLPLRPFRAPFRIGVFIDSPCILPPHSPRREGNKIVLQRCLSRRAESLQLQEGDFCQQVRLPVSKMPLFGKIIVIKRNGTDGIHFPLTASSCLFGRKTECDIRIQLPQVSKEHCKIEVNENKEAILINLSTVNPTQLNGNSFQQPAHLKHGDVFTIVDRSFRFEYPPQSTPKKRLSRTPKNETLQVLHVQQVAEVELQSPTSKSPHTSDKNIECEGQNFGENDKQSTEEDISRVVPAKQHATPKSTYRTAKSNRRENEMSPFSKLYELLKNEIDVKTQKDGNEEIPMPRQAETNAQQISLLVFPSGQETQIKEKETIIGEDIEQSKVKEQEINNVELNQISIEGNSSKKTNEISSANSGEPQTGQDSSLGVKATEISNEIQKKDVVCSSVGGNESCILGKSNKYSKQRRNSKQLTPRKSLNAEEVLKEIHYETSSVSVTKERDSETFAFSPGYSNSKSPKGSVRQSKKNSNKSPLSELLTPERLTPKDESSASRKHHSGARRGRRMSSGKMAEETLERDPSQEHYKNVDIKGSDVKEKLTTENYQQKLEVEDANIVLGPHRLSSKRRCSESVVLLRDDEVASEINISSLPTEDKKSGETKRLPQKRKSREIELLHQPLGKRKRVSFGGHLSPELFDKSLPPNSPLRRGAIPARLSLPFGNSPRAVLKKGQGFKRLVIKDLSEHLQRQKSSQKNLPARRSPAASPPARRSPAASPPARRSPAASPPARRSLAASPPALEKMSPKLTANSPSNTPFTKGRFSISHISTPSPTSKEQGTAATEVKESDGDFTGVKTPESFHINQEHQISVPTTPKQLIRRSIRFSVKRTPMKRRSDAVETIHSKRRSGASKANLLVAKSWAEVVKLGVARPQVKAVKKCVLKGKSAKKLTKSPKLLVLESRGNYERELKQEKKMEDSLEKTSLPFVRSRNGNIKNEQELQESLEHACISPKESESVKNIENIEKEKMSNGSQTQSHNLSNSVISLLLTKMDPVQEPAMQLQRELNQYLKDSDDKELLFENPVAPQLNLIQESIDLSSKDKKSTRANQQKIEIKENPSSLRECEENLKENVNLLELPVLMKERIEDQKEEAVAFTSVVKNLGRKERTNQCMQEEIISKIHVHKQLDKNKEAVSSVEINGTFHSSRRGKRSLESHDKDSLMLQRETTSMKQNLQTVHQSVTNHILIMENDQSLKTANVSSSSKNVRGHPLQIGLIAPEDKSDQDSVKNNEKVALSVRKRSRGEKKLEMLESLVPAKRTRRGKTEDNKQGFTEEHGAKEKPQRQTTRNPCRAATAKCIQTDEQDFAHSIIEAAAVEESEINKPTLEIMVTEMKGRKSLRVKSRKQLEETEKVSTEMGPESVRPVQETKRTSKETVVKTHKAIKNETKAVQGTKEAETGQSLKLKKSHFENTNEAPLDVYSLQANRNSIKKTNQRPGNKRGQKGILDIKEGEFAKNEKMIPQNIPETEPETISTKDSLGSLQTVQNSKIKEAQNNPTAAMVYGPKDVERTVLRHGKRIRKGDGKQEASETKQIEILENNPTEANENTSRRDREKKVHFELEEANSASLRGKHILPEGNDKDQNETSENIPSQANENLSRRGRRKEVDLTPHAVSSTSLREKYSLPESDAKKEAPKKDQDAALESTASPTKENTSRRGRRKQVDHKVLAANSTSFGGKCSLPGDSSKEEMSEDQNVPLEAIVSPTKEKLSRRGRRNQVSLTSQAASCTSLRGKSSLTENDDKDAIPKEDQNVPLGSTISQAKANPPRKGRRKQVDLTTQAARSTSLRGKSSLPENDNKEKTPKEDQNVPLENITSQVSKRGRRKQVDLTTQAASSTSLRGKSSLPENDGKEKIPKEDPNVTLGNTTEAKANPPRKGRRKQVDLTTQAASSTSLRGKSSLPENDNKEKTPKEDQNVPLENITSQASKRGRRKQVDLTSQATNSTSLRGKRHLPEDEKAAKKLKSECGESITLQKETRNKTKGELGKGGISMIQSAGGTERKTRASARTRK
ncbi:proliferation marker protein Ki-67, partial [Trachemys scripta elegans]|uniref:proliferation marker protein Ki-67 n=1 Tax=Trachemys scripta elegans TaxID=31138 RepID=UPI0015547938